VLFSIVGNLLKYNLRVDSPVIDYPLFC